MNNTARSNSGLPELATRAQSLHGEIVATRKRGLSLAMDAGDVLIQAKELVPHGGWSDWLASVGINARTARLYMQVARGRDDLKTATVAGLREAAEWLAARTDTAKLVKMIEDANGESVCIDFKLPLGNVWSTFWCRGVDSYFVAWVESWHDGHGQCDAQAAWFKKPVTAKDAVSILRLQHPQARVIESYGIDNNAARSSIESMGAKLTYHSWGARLEDAA